MPRVTVGNWRQDEDFLRNRSTDAVGDAAGADKIHIQRKMFPMLLDGSAGHNTDLLSVDGFVDFRPGEFVVAVLCECTTGHESFPCRTSC